MNRIRKWKCQLLAFEISCNNLRWLCLNGSSKDKGFRLIEQEKEDYKLSTESATRLFKTKETKLLILSLRQFVWKIPLSTSDVD